MGIFLHQQTDRPTARVLARHTEGWLSARCSSRHGRPQPEQRRAGAGTGRPEAVWPLREWGLWQASSLLAGSPGTHSRLLREQPLSTVAVVQWHLLPVFPVGPRCSGSWGPISAAPAPVSFSWLFFGREKTRPLTIASDPVQAGPPEVCANHETSL